MAICEFLKKIIYEIKEEFVSKNTLAAPKTNLLCGNRPKMQMNIAVLTWKTDFPPKI